jgi:aryl-alcohol dehydrogenase-like predicted oxidoreductase
LGYEFHKTKLLIKGREKMNIDYRNLGRTGVKITPLCLGTMNFGYRTSEQESIAIINRFIDAGLNFIDTANFYGQPLHGGKGQGIAEVIVGKAIKGKRDKIILATKFGLPMRTDDPNARGNSRRHIIASVEQSLQRLKTDYIDLYQVHRPDPVTPIDETLRAMDDLVRSGKVRYIGTSTFLGWQLMEALWVADRLNLHRVVTEQPRYSLLDRQIETEVIPVAKKFGIGILAYSPLGGGVLTGKYKRDISYPDDSRASDEAWGRWAASFLSEKVFDLMERVDKIASSKDCSPGQLALAWVLQQPGITSAIIGPKTLNHLVDNIGALEITITESELKELDVISKPGRRIY